MAATATTNDDGTAKITLYWLNNSRAQSIIWLLEELKMTYELEIFHRNKQSMLAPPSLDKIHPLGKSPVVGIAAPGREPILLAESGHITQYLCEHLPEGKRLTPPRWRDGQEGRLCGETEAWLRFQYLLHYVEGSLMPNLVMALVLSRLKSPQVPFFMRPITGAAANRIYSLFVFPNAQKHLALLDDYLASSGGKYICGNSLTAADILLSFPLIVAKDRWDGMGRWEGGSWAKAHPRVAAYVTLLETEPGYKASLDKVAKMDSTASASL
ncbi:hypothetical protein RJ55_01183 [Drechmeria coniospora]|nr:hypothetical protein RJ55_01183 [Drechmeria coniospora]